MKTSPTLKQLIEQIAQKHALDLEETGAYLRLDLNGDRLIIENIGANRISIAYQFILLGEWTSDPEIVVWTGYTSNQWIPIELYQVKDGWRACTDIDVTGKLIGFHRREWQAWLAEFTETIVVPNLITQGWLEQGIKSNEPVPTYTLEQMRERGYLIEETNPSEEEVDDDCPF